MSRLPDSAGPSGRGAAIYCHAPHRDPARAPARCDVLLGYLPRPVTPTALLAHAPELPDGATYVRCPRCKTWNRFEDRP